MTSMPMLFGLVIVAAFAGTLLLTRVIYRNATRLGLMDLPNDRSLHQQATPRGGGLGIVVTTLLGLLVFRLMDRLSTTEFTALFLGGVVIALVGWLDDRADLHPGAKFLAHCVAAGLALYCLGGLPTLDLGIVVLESSWWSNLLVGLGLVWLLNLYNFMDGIDGLAAMEAVFVAAVGGGLAWWMGGKGVGAAAFILAAASLAFLYWNWPPARIFMGDVGSCFLGFELGVLSLLSADRSGPPIGVWMILLGVFICDATVTLLRRVIRGDRWHSAHRTHAYQHLAQRWGGHRAVTATVIGVNLGWLAPCALASSLYPWAAPLITVVAWVPLISLAWWLNAGVPSAEQGR